MKNLIRLCVLLAVPIVCEAQASVPFEAAVAGQSTQCVGIATPLHLEQVEWFNPGFWSTGTFAVATDGQRVFGLARSGGGLRVIHYGAPWNPTTFYTKADATPVAITQAANGRIFIASIRSSIGELLVLSPSGALEAIHPFGPGEIAVAPDGCTLYAWGTGGPTISRINGCTGLPLPPFAVLPANVQDVYPLTDGTVLVAAGQSVYLLNAAGIIVRTIPLSSLGVSDDEGMIPAQVALSADRTLYIAVTWDCLIWAEELSPFLLRASFDDGVPLSRREFEEVSGIHSLILGPASAAAVPVLSDVGLLFVTIAIAEIGLIALRR